MKVLSKFLVLVLFLAGSSVSWAEEQAASTTAADVAATKAASSVSLFPDSSVYVWAYYYMDKAGGADDYLMLMPHFRTPVLNNFVTMDAYIELKTEGETAHVQKPTVYVDFEKEFVANDYFIVAPYVEFVNPFQSTNSQILAMFLGQASLPIQTGIGKISPYILTESGVGINTSKTELAANYQDGPKGLQLTGDEVKDRGLAASYMGKAEKYPISTYTRAGVGYTPSGIDGLKMNFVVNVIASPTDTYTLDAKTKGVLKVDSKWSTTTQPMLQIYYKVNDKIALRNETTRNYDGYFEKVSDSQKKGGAISNVTRLTYTIF